MDNSIVPKDQEIGRTLRRLRRDKDLTIRNVAEAAGLSASYISQVERGLLNPTVSGLKRIAEALDTTLSDFFNEPQSSLPINHYVVRKEQRKSLVYPDSQIRYDLLCPDLHHQIEFICMTAPPGASTGPEPLRHHGEECALVLVGRVQVHVGDQTYVLEEGDSIYYPSEVPHSWTNIGDCELKMIWAAHPPSF